MNHLVPILRGFQQARAGTNLEVSNTIADIAQILGELVHALLPRSTERIEQASG